MKMNKLKRSHDRKVTNLVNKAGNGSLIQNTFGLPAGKNYSCPSATSVCEKVCYAGKLEKLYKAVKANLLHNWELLKDADHDTMENLLSDMINDFRKDCDKRNAEKLFRIHWDGDFFSDDYAFAWKHVILNNPDIKFWVYTRVMSAALILNNMSNLSLYYSTDSENIDNAKVLSNEHGIKLAYLADTFAIGKEQLLNLVNAKGVPCPENSKKIKLIDQGGSACVKCGQCVFNRNNILFSASKK
jgi:polyphosphate kinase